MVSGQGRAGKLSAPRVCGEGTRDGGAKSFDASHASLCLLGFVTTEGLTARFEVLFIDPSDVLHRSGVLRPVYISRVDVAASGAPFDLSQTARLWGHHDIVTNSHVARYSINAAKREHRLRRSRHQRPCHSMEWTKNGANVDINALAAEEKYIQNPHVNAYERKRAQGILQSSTRGDIILLLGRLPCGSRPLQTWSLPSQAWKPPLCRIDHLNFSFSFDKNPLFFFSPTPGALVVLVLVLALPGVFGALPVVGLPL